jgi:hypothetical protein
MGALTFLCGALVVYFLFVRVPTTDSKVAPTTQATPTTPRAPATTKPKDTDNPPKHTDNPPKDTDNPPKDTDNPPVNTEEGFVVDASAPDGRGFRTIGAALSKAPAGAKIRIKKGTYRETIVLNKKVELLGDDPREQIVVFGDGGPALTVAAEGAGGLVKGITLLCKTATDEQRPKRVRKDDNSLPATVTISNGSLELDHCVIGWQGDAGLNRRNAGACVELSGPDANLVMKNNCRLHNGYQGLWVRAGATPEIKGCTMHENQVGIWVDRAGGTFTDCEVFKNKATNVTVIGRGKPVTLHACDVHHSEEGISVSNGGDVALFNCKVHDNDGWAFVVYGANSRLDARRCRPNDVYDNKVDKDKGRQWYAEYDQTLQGPEGP